MLKDCLEIKFLFSKCQENSTQDLARKTWKNTFLSAHIAPVEKNIFLFFSEKMEIQNLKSKNKKWISIFSEKKIKNIFSTGAV